jgi:hypothetical protein
MTWDSNNRINLTYMYCKDMKQVKTPQASFGISSDKTFNPAVTPSVRCLKTFNIKVQKLCNATCRLYQSVSRQFNELLGLPIPEEHSVTFTSNITTTSIKIFEY